LKIENMPIFSYKALDSTGKSYKGKLEAADKFALGKALKEKGDQIISAEVFTGRSKLAFVMNLSLRLGKVKEQEKIIFSRNLGSMIDAGLPLSRGLSVLERQTRNKKFKNILAGLQDSINKGQSFHDSLKKYPDVFSSLFTSMVAAGEEGGNLSMALKNISGQMEKTHAIKKKIKGAMMYPAVVVSLMIVLGFLMMIFIVPTLSATFSELGVDLPLSTRIIIAISTFFRDHYLLALLIAIAVFVGAYFGFRSRVGKKMMDWVFLHMPLISPLTKGINSARTARTLSSLLVSGVDYIVAIQITENVLQNSFYKKVLVEAGKRVEKGEPISKILLENEKLYPAFVGEMANVGEETGNLAKMFESVATFYEDEVEQKTKDMSTLIEPFLMIIIGTGVGFFAISMLSPTYSLVDAI